MRDAQIAYENQSPPEDPASSMTEEDIAELLFDLLTDEVPQWLTEAMAYALTTGEAQYLLNQCEKNLRDKIEHADRAKIRASQQE